MIIWYRNSVLASILSICGCAGIAAAVADLLQEEAMRELSTPEAAGIIAAGLVLAILGKVISVRKAKKKAAGAAKASGAQPAAVSAGKTGKAKASVVFAGLFFLLAAGFGVWAMYMQYGDIDVILARHNDIIAYAACLVLMLASFRTRATQEVSVLHVLGFLGCLAAEANSARVLYMIGKSAESAMTPEALQAMLFTPALLVAAYLLMTLFALFAMKGVKRRLGGIVRWLWPIPGLAVAAAYGTAIRNSYMMDLLMRLSTHGEEIMQRPDFLNVLSQLSMSLAVLMTGLGLRGVSRANGFSAPKIQEYTKVNLVPEKTVQPVEEPRVRVRTVSQPAPVQAQPVQQVTYEQPVQQVPMQQTVQTQPVQQASAAPQANQAEKEKQIRACKELLECGILSQEEYDQKVREIMRG